MSNKASTESGFFTTSLVNDNGPPNIRRLPSQIPWHDDDDHHHHQHHPGRLRRRRQYHGKHLWLGLLILAGLPSGETKPDQVQRCDSGVLKIKHGRVVKILDNQNLIVGCKPGYFMIGSHHVNCGPDGIIWSKKLPKCRKSKTKMPFVHKNPKKRVHGARRAPKPGPTHSSQHENSIKLSAMRNEVGSIHRRLSPQRKYQDLMLGDEPQEDYEYDGAEYYDDYDDYDNYEGDDYDEEYDEEGDYESTDYGLDDKPNGDDEDVDLEGDDVYDETLDELENYDDEKLEEREPSHEKSDHRDTMEGAETYDEDLEAGSDGTEQYGDFYDYNYQDKIETKADGAVVTNEQTKSVGKDGNVEYYDVDEPLEASLASDLSDPEEEHHETRTEDDQYETTEADQYETIKDDQYGTTKSDEYDTTEEDQYEITEEDQDETTEEEQYRSTDEKQIEAAKEDNQIEEYDETRGDQIDDTNYFPSEPTKTEANILEKEHRFSDDEDIDFGSGAIGRYADDDEDQDEGQGSGAYESYEPSYGWTTSVLPTFTTTPTTPTTTTSTSSSPPSTTTEITTTPRETTTITPDVNEMTSTMKTVDWTTSRNFYQHEVYPTNPVIVTDDEDLYNELNIDHEGSGFEGSGDEEPHTESENHFDTKPTITIQERQEIRNAFYIQNEADILRLDTSCVLEFKEAPKIEHANVR